jgi:hypothetical protein
MSRARAAACALIVAACTGCGGEERRALRTLAPPAEPDGAPAPAAADAQRGAHLLDRIAIVGASLSAGVAAPSIATSLRADLPADADVLDAASVTFFQDPFASGAAAVAAARAHRPTLTVALDFLFWFAYADLPADARRDRLEHGLALLASLPGTLVVGDLPDMRDARPRILGPAAVPSPAELAAMNERIRGWAAARPRAVVLPMAAWTRPLVTGEAIELASGERVAAGDLMFFDRLHPNALGAWHLLDLADRALEAELAIPAAALQLARPAAAP